MGPHQGERNIPIVTFAMVATIGGIRAADASGNRVVEHIIAVAMVAYEMYPNPN